MDQLESRKAYVKKWFKNPYFVVLLLIILLAIGARVYFFNANHGNHWYDESIYAMKSKVMANEGFTEGMISHGWHRGFIMEIFWSLFFKVGLADNAMRLSELILSVLAVLLTYLIGKELCNKKVALIAAVFMSVFWLNLFYTARIMLTIPTLFFWTLTCYLFWIGYVKKKVNWIILILIPIFIIGMFTSLLYAPIAIFLGVFLLITDKFAFLKNKKVYLSLFLGALILIPYILWAHANIGNGLAYWTATLSVGATYDETFSANSGIMGYVNFFPTYLGTFLLVLFLIGLVKFADLFLGPDLLLKGNKKLQKKLFIFLWIVVTILANAILVPAFSVDYYLMQIFPAVFLVLGEGIMFVGNIVKKYQKQAGIALIIVFVIIGAVIQLKMANTMITYKADSFGDVRASALWIKQDSKDPNDFVFSPSGVMTEYFSEREVLQYPQNESEFDILVNEKNPKYMIVSIYERPPQWTFDYNSRHSDEWEPVKSYTTTQNGQEVPTLIIFRRK